MFRQVLRQGARAAKRAGQVCKEAARPSSGASYVVAAKASTHAGARKGSSVAATALSVAATIALSPVALAANDERTYIMIKPDGVHRGLIADIIERFERKGYKLVACKVVVPSKDLAGQHYAEHDGKSFYPKLVDFLSSGAVVAMVWEGKDVIQYGRTMIGSTNPLASAPGTIRGDYGIDVGRNIIHGSDSVESAQREISLWFKAEELAEYQLAATKWVYE